MYIMYAHTMHLILHFILVLCVFVSKIAATTKFVPNESYSQRMAEHIHTKKHIKHHSNERRIESTVNFDICIIHYIIRMHTVHALYMHNTRSAAATEIAAEAAIVNMVWFLLKPVFFLARSSLASIYFHYWRNQHCTLVVHNIFFQLGCFFMCVCVCVFVVLLHSTAIEYNQHTKYVQLWINARVNMHGKFYRLASIVQ